MISSLEIRWLKPEKWLSYPTILIVNDLEGPYGAYYQRPCKDEFLIENRYVDGEKGLIVVNEAHTKDFEGCVAHEWRHHWQRDRGWKYDGVAFNCGIDDDISVYKKAIRSYFMKSHSEIDALLYEHKHVSTDLTSQWLEWIHGL